MKVTVDIPEELYSQVEARAALGGLSVRELTIELYRRWLVECLAPSTAPSPERWLEEWLALADEMVGGPGVATTCDHLQAGRDRLEGRRAGG